jgi:hypothetical protein
VEAASSLATRAYRSCAAVISAHSAMYSERCSTTLTASRDSDTAVSARLPSQRPARTVQGGTPKSGTLLPWLISPTCPRALFVFNGLSRQSADDEQTDVKFGSDIPSATLHGDDMYCRRSPLCDNRGYAVSCFESQGCCGCLPTLGQKRTFIPLQQCHPRNDWTICQRCVIW